MSSYCGCGWWWHRPCLPNGSLSNPCSRWEGSSQTKSNGNGSIINVQSISLNSQFKPPCSNSSSLSSAPQRPRELLLGRRASPSRAPGRVAEVSRGSPTRIHNSRTRISWSQHRGSDASRAHDSWGQSLVSRSIHSPQPRTGICLRSISGAAFCASTWRSDQRLGRCSRAADTATWISHFRLRGAASGES